MAPSKILLVDDDYDVISGYRDILSEYFEVFLAANVNEALRILDLEPIKVAVVDLVMPVQSGQVLLGEINRRNPRPMKIVLSAFVDTYFNDHFQNQYKVFAVLRKPILDFRELEFQIQQAVLEYNDRFSFRSAPSQFINAEDVLARLGVSRPTLYKYLRHGLPSKQIGGRRLFNWDEVTTWIETKQGKMKSAN